MSRNHGYLILWYDESEFKKLAFDFEQKYLIPHPFQNRRWFMKRHSNIPLRSPETTLVARAREFNPVQAFGFYDLLWELVEKNHLEASGIFNMDETGIKLQHAKFTERGKLTIAVCCWNAIGSFIPPFVIFVRESMQERLLDGAPPGYQASCTYNGWINGKNFLQWLQFFVEQVRTTPKRKIPLKYFKALDFVEENNVSFLSFELHTTHKMEQLEIAV
ncbi:hypothetical protein PR048_022676 [Dryococelus australis]|uniref:DDE-1 domain-containing protein n=1 Tax=Dryococelus australis TaxID=614101 RepID=A0ABQ9GRW9_9NEOP|nr:hypothetical protein PR048_022676 [Dryococelus australis]